MKFYEAITALHSKIFSFVFPPQPHLLPAPKFPQRSDLTRPRSDPAPPAAARANHEWSCDVCLKSFSQNSSYKNHMRTHSAERPYACEVCSIGFKERYHLKKHMLFKHSDEAREECRVCGKRFKVPRLIRLLFIFIAIIRKKYLHKINHCVIHFKIKCVFVFSKDFLRLFFKCYYIFNVLVFHWTV